MAPKKGVCRHFLKGHCTFGDKCKFLHDSKDPSRARNDIGPITDKSAETSTALRRWKTTIETASYRSRTHGIQDTVVRAKELLDSGSHDAQHDVITALATENGLKAVRKASEASTNELREMALPLLQVLSHPAAVSSMRLEQHVTTIYNTLYGGNGVYGHTFFKRVTELLQQLLTDQSEAPTSFNETLACALDVFSRMIIVNQTAAISDPITRVAKDLEAVGAHVFSDPQPKTYAELSAIKSMQQINISLGFGQDIAEAADPAELITNKLADFHIEQDLPGSLSRTGVRHNNDFADITEIQIMPTAEEISSTLPEYLPAQDPNTHHRKGVRGLLDRQFRLLREDTVGQLRDAVDHFNRNRDGKIQKSVRTQTQDFRTNIFSNATITASFFDKRYGLLHVVEFDQPQKFRAAEVGARKRAWLESKDLSAEACVCLVDSEKQATFYSVIARYPNATDDEARHHYRLDLTVLNNRITSLHSSPRRAAVIIQLVNFNGKTATEVLAHQNRRSRYQAPQTLIEFPGILLASFMHTLGALQKMSRGASLPFSDLLAPAASTEASAVQAEPPSYAKRAAFRFDLSQVCKDRALFYSPQQAFDLSQFSEASGLDESQAQAFIHALSNRFALIQGPPGTGKSFVGVKLIQTLLANRDAAKLGPILCVCYTNHALDQILEHLVDNGIRQIIRIGGRSKSAALAEVNLKKVSATIERTKYDKYLIGSAHGQLETVQNQATMHLGNIISADSMANIRRYLRSEEPTFYRHFFGETTADGFQEVRHDPEKAFERWLSGGSRNPGDTVPESADLSQLTHDQRQQMLKRWVGEIRDDSIRAMWGICDKFKAAKKTLDDCYDEASLRCLQQAHVIGITTTGLAKNIDLLQKLHSKALIVEEAGEVMEAHMLPALLTSLEHVIAIGDHQQLRPTIAKYELSIENPRGARYSLDLSLFERLIYPKFGLPQLPFSTLQTQRRMHPLISRLVRDSLYPKLVDGPGVSDYPDVTSMRHRLFWLDHDQLEVSDDLSKSNDWEVEMTAALVTHLVKQGTYRTSQITVLTPYLAQLRKLRRRFARVYEIVVGDKDQDGLVAAGLDEPGEAGQSSNHSDVDPQAVRTSVGDALRISTVDNYQGEEADIIVVSLVRSNEAGKAGFLRTSNRINVLLSRARHGMYIIGNSRTASTVAMWKQVMETLMSDKAFGREIPIYCPRHPESTALISTPDDFSRLAPEGGCDLTCNKRLKCGHRCVVKCHADHLHNSVTCQMACPRLKDGCTHPCQKVCGVPCDSKCQTRVQDVPLPCGHIASQLRCFESQAVEKVQCQHKVSKSVPGCNHIVEVACSQDVRAEDFHCPAVCDALLSCGHKCARTCFECNTTDEQGKKDTRHGECQRPCGRNHTTCSHACKDKCHGDAPCVPCRAICEVQCAHSRCNKLCSEPCAPCAETCEWSCEHQGACQLACSVPCSRLPCSERCEKNLTCGHQCPSICGETCPSRRFCQTCGDEDVLQMVVDFIMFSKYSEIDLAADPVVVPPCGHLQTVSSFDGQMDMAKFYNFDANEKITAISKSLQPFESRDIKVCATCRGSLRSLNRYNRIVKRGLIDEATKRFIVWANAGFVKLEKQGNELEKKMNETLPEATFRPSNQSNNAPIEIQGSSTQMIGRIRNLYETKKRYDAILYYRKSLEQFCSGVVTHEQPFRRVWDLYRAFSKSQEGNDDLVNFEEAADSAMNTRSHLLARSLRLHTDAGILGDFIEICIRSKVACPTLRNLSVNTSQARQECDNLSGDAAIAMQPVQQVEALLNFAFFTAAEIRCLQDSQQIASLREGALHRLELASTITQAKPSTAMLAPKIEVARIALTGEFQSMVTDDEMRAVYAAMATEFRGTGHWYRCENGHPFTIGECGMPMEQARCPQCGAAIGGQNHQAVEGVAVARDIEAQFGLGR